MNKNYIKSDFTPIFRHFTNVLCDRVKVSGLPEEIDEKFFLYHVLLFGRILFFKDSGKFHVMWFSGKGKKNEYYLQNEFLVVNPFYNNSKTMNFKEDNSCVVYSDINAYIENCDCGLYDMVSEYSSIIEEIDKSINALAKNSKVIAFLTGSDNAFIASARLMIERMWKNNDSIGIMEESLIDNIKVNPIADKMDYKFSELIKTRQYYISDFYQKIGVATNQNMKKERLTDNESELIENSASVDFNYILNNLNTSIEKTNKMFDLNISFKLNEKEEEKQSSQLDKDNSGGDSDEWWDKSNRIYFWRPTFRL